MNEEVKMRVGNINCSCGQSFYVESVADSTSCIRCNKVHDISMFPLKEAEEVPFEEVKGE